jgi:hypothetical protein
MAEPTFDVIFQGQTLPGADGAVVRANLAKLFKTDAARVEAMFNGQRVVIKKNVDAATAETYTKALNKAGAVVEIVAVAAPSATPLAPVAPKVAPEPPPPLTIAEPGVILVEPTPMPMVTFDTSSLSLAAVGVDLVTPVATAPPQYDLSKFKLDPPGTVLVDAIPVPPARIDTSGLSLSDP